VIKDVLGGAGELDPDGQKVTVSKSEASDVSMKIPRVRKLRTHNQLVCPRSTSIVLTCFLHHRRKHKHLDRQILMNQVSLDHFHAARCKLTEDIVMHDSRRWASSWKIM